MNWAEMYVNYRVHLLQESVIYVVDLFDLESRLWNANMYYL